jgi:hypothetical protein
MKSVEMANKAMRERLNLQQTLNEAIEEQQLRMRELKKIIRFSSLHHHLLSTKSIPGILNPSLTKHKMTPFGVPFEDVIQRYSITRASA